MVPRPLRLGTAVALIGIVIAASCSGSTAENSPATTSVPVVGKEPSDPLVIEPDAIDITLVGDWLPNSGPFIDNPAYGQLTGPIVDHLTTDDLTIANLECAVSRDAPRRQGLDFAVRCLPRDLASLEEAGVDVVTLGNDHVTDFGAAGVEDTIASLARRDIIAVGPGPDPVVVDTPDGQVAVLAIPRNALFPLSDADTMAAISDAGALDLPLIVSIHWGETDERAAAEADNELASRMVAAGADVVMGHGAGRLHAFRRIEDAAVFMGLGRFVWPVDPSKTVEADTAVGSVALIAGEARAGCLLAATIGVNGTPSFDNRDPSCR